MLDQGIDADAENACRARSFLLAAESIYCRFLIRTRMVPDKPRGTGGLLKAPDLIRRRTEPDLVG